MTTAADEVGQHVHDAALRRLITEAEISRVLVQFCQGVDRKQWEQVRACYHPDAIDHHGEFIGNPTQLTDWMQKTHEHVSFCMHQLSNISIRLDKGNDQLARVESYAMSRKTVTSAEHDAYLRATGAVGPVRRTVGVRYVDTFEHRDGSGWRILDRVVVHEWMRLDPAETFVEFAAAIPMSRRDQSDLLFASDLRSTPHTS